MQAQIELSPPIFELKGFASRIDLSAWLSGLSFTVGLMLAHVPVSGADSLSLAIKFGVVVAAFAIFLGAVLAIQRQMRLSLLANSFGSPRRLVTNGIFRHSRNPIYVAFFLPLCALAIFSLSSAIAAIGIYVLAMNLTVVRKEERELSAAFGPEYAAYLRSTPRWLV